MNSTRLLNMPWCNYPTHRFSPPLSGYSSTWRAGMQRIWWKYIAVIDKALHTEFLKVTLLQPYSIAVGTTKYTIHVWIHVPQVFSINYDMTLWGLWLEMFGTLEDIEREPVCSFAPPYRCISMQGKTGFWYPINLTYRQVSKNFGSQVVRKCRKNEKMKRKWKENITTIFITVRWSRNWTCLT